ncbi:MAG: hypothetical protein J6D34_12070 [Atopobiaceae bacterium]|nr:hypothetical protein [Atopobiaceae bacterium]
MRRTNRIVPTYTGDVSGACSALFELGGMVVIHDPSGCNSTYNTHDETRWYNHDSLIFITGLVERDAILGNDEKLVRDVVEAARELQPRFIALCNSPVPFISGTDFRAICKLVERECGIPCFYVRTNGMHDYVVGAGNAFVELARRFVGGASVVPGTCNILGVTPLDLGIAGSDAPLRSFAEESGFFVTSCWAMGSPLDELERAAEAQVNLVVSATGLALARHLRETYGTPYVVGFPVDGFAPRLADAMAVAASSGECQWPCRSSHEGLPHEGALCVGEPVMMGSLARCMEAQDCGAVRVVCPLEAGAELMGSSDLFAEGEEGVEEALRDARLVVADELYAPIIPSSARHVPLPHQALSGRNGWRCAQDPCAMRVADLLA